MILVYRPEGADERRWAYRPEKMLTSEAEVIERTTGWTYQEFGEKLVRGSVQARRTLLWVYLKRGEPTLKVTQVDVPAGSIQMEYERSELQAMRDRVDANDALGDAERQSALAQLDNLIAEAPEVPEDPKASANSDASSG